MCARWKFAVTTSLLFIGASTARAQGTIEELEVDPSPRACTDRTVIARVSGTGSCQDLRLSFDFPELPPQVTSTGPPSPSGFTVQFTHTYEETGVYTVRTGSLDPSCSGALEQELEVAECLLTPSDLGRLTESLAPEVTGGLGLVQPGNPFPVVIFGRRFGSTPGTIFLEGDFGTVPLTLLEWGRDGKFASGFVPAQICGVPDHEATIYVQSVNGFVSNKWPVRFTAAREVRPVPRDLVTVLTCSDDADKDCCNGACDESDGDWFCYGDANITITGCHYNEWGDIGNNQGTDRYRVDLSGGLWRIESWSLNVHPFEGWARLQPSDAHMAQSSDFAVDWFVTPNDFANYDLFVNMSGPCGTSHRPGVSRGALRSLLRSLESQASLSDTHRRAVMEIREAQSRIDAETRRKARDEDGRVQALLERLRGESSDETVTAARELDALRGEAWALLRRAADPDEIATSEEEIARDATALLERARRLVPMPPPDPPP